ncbi:hypothetical protein Q047_01859 [Pseudomonas aeruginosa BWHPSA042]|nr:hypothetical protein Q047_01859 [Pseudomonas aeruginosa BWHPSA042]
MIEIRSLRDLLRLLFIYQREFKLAALSAVVIIVLGAFLLPAKYESNARLLVKPGRDSTLPIEISNSPPKMPRPRPRSSCTAASWRSTAPSAVAGNPAPEPAIPRPMEIGHSSPAIAAPGRGAFLCAARGLGRAPRRFSAMA